MKHEPTLTLHYVMIVRREADRIMVTIGNNEIRLTEAEAHNLGRSIIRLSEPQSVTIGGDA